jgi:RND family efflux transporter MFP subunit
MNRRNGFVLLGLVFAALFGYRLYEELGSADAPQAGRGSGGAGRAQPVEIATPESVRLVDRASLVGALQAKQQVQVTPRASGRVLSIEVDRGDRVRAGQVLARLEDDELRQQVRRAEAALQVARASLSQRGAELDNVRAEEQRYLNLEEDGVVSSQQLAQARTSVAVSAAQSQLAEAQVAQAEAELEELRIRLGQTTIVSPLGGVVGERYVDPGALVSPTTPVVLILDLSRMVTEVNVPERDIMKIQVGTAARVSLDAVPGEQFEGRVLRISPLLDSQTRTAPVEIEIDNPRERLKAEMFARVALNLTTERQALLVSRDALVYRNGNSGVFVVEGDRARFQRIETGLVEGDMVEILTGVSAADVIVTRGANLLKSGDMVRVVAEGEPTS